MGLTIVPDEFDQSDWLDEQLLADDAPSDPAWRRRARGGRTVNGAIAGVPRKGQLTTRIPIEQWRFVKTHVDRLGVPLGTYIRQAVGMRMISEGVDPQAIDTLMTMGSHAGD